MTPKTPRELTDAASDLLDWSADPRCHPQEEPLCRALADALLYALGDPQSSTGTLLDGIRRDLRRPVTKRQKTPA